MKTVPLTSILSIVLLCYLNILTRKHAIIVTKQALNLMSTLMCFECVTAIFNGFIACTQACVFPSIFKFKSGPFFLLTEILIIRPYLVLTWHSLVSWSREGCLFFFVSIAGLNELVGQPR